MPSKTHAPGSADDWLRYAKSDLALARIEKPDGVLLENLCFHTQQAAEKALKAALIFVEIDYPKTHNIRTLLDLIPADIDIPKDVEESVILTDYAVETRYPGNSESVDEEELRQAIGLAEAVRYVSSTNSRKSVCKTRSR
ncbi:MAG: HEPN domain-containing protein [Candidatus Latescibacteria bacterium]|nr:HEPN domain-containing protein [Candidatus Latescibacterota bacterium]